MRIGGSLQPLGLGPRVLTPDLGPPEENALLGREAIDFVIAPRAWAGQIGHEREPQAAVVRGVFTEGQPAVDMGVARYGIAGVLIRHAGRALLVRLAVSRRPPVAQVAFAVELAPLIVESVRQLVTDDCAGGAVVDGGVTPRTIEGRLQNAGWKIDVVAIGAVVGVDRRRRHAPFGAIDGLADPRQ